ncbi:hypothetical protein CW710_01430 [Candidatus Bathyarchaeota archaeon]|nr:MAG: hypothetical protein CW710_01430 [Candidatus Bathyarchaeota archaeon]
MFVNHRRGQVVAVGTLLAVLVLISVTAFLYELYTAQQEMRLLDEERSREKLEILEAGFWNLEEYTPTSTEPTGMEHALSRLDGIEATFESKQVQETLFEVDWSVEFDLFSPNDIDRLYLRYVGTHTAEASQEVYLWNYTSGEWVMIAQAGPYEGYEDAVIQVEGFKHLISPEGEMKLRSVSYANEPFECKVDLLTVEAYLEDSNEILVRVLNDSPSTVVIDAVWIISADSHERRSINVALAPGEEYALNLEAQNGGFKCIVKIVTRRGSIFQVTIRPRSTIQ